MSHNIPVYFFRVGKSQVLKKLVTWEDALPLLEKSLGNNRLFGLRESVSRNWWHQNALSLIGRGLHVNGLEFVNAEVACLCEDTLYAAFEALGIVLSSTADGIPNLGRFEHTDIERLPSDEHRKAFSQAKPSSNIKVAADWGFEATVSFFSFIKSLHEATREAIEEGQCLIYVQMQP